VLTSVRVLKQLLMEKKRTNSDPFGKSTRKHSIYPPAVLAWVPYDTIAHTVLDEVSIAEERLYGHL
jgi:hypothetical protein